MVGRPRMARKAAGISSGTVAAMPDDVMRTFDPGDLTATERYKLLIGLVVPRPIGWIGTRSAAGVNNLAPYSFFNVVSSDPPTVLYSVNRSARVKDSLQNVLETGEFTASIVTEGTAAAMNITSGEYDPEVDEFAVAGLTSIMGKLVEAPMVGEATARLECRMTTTLDIGRAGNGPTNTVVLGEVVAIHVAERVLDGTRVIPSELRAVGRMAGSGYTRTVDGYFEMPRPNIEG